MATDTTGVLTHWNGEGVRVEVRQVKDGYEVNVLRAGQISAKVPCETEIEARKIFERWVEDIVLRSYLERRLE